MAMRRGRGSAPEIPPDAIPLERIDRIPKWLIERVCASCEQVETRCRCDAVERVECYTCSGEAFWRRRPSNVVVFADAVAEIMSARIQAARSEAVR